MEIEIARGIAFYKGGSYKEFAEAFGRAAALNPNDPIPHIYLGLALQAQFIPNGQQKASAVQAYGEFQRAIALDLSAWPPLIFMANLERDLGSFAESRRWYERALQLDPSNAAVYVALGALGMQSGVADQDSARTDFERALSLDPRNVTAMRFLDALYRARGNESAAADWRRKAADIETENSLRMEQQRQRGITSPLRWPSPLAGTYQIIRDVAIVNAPPPPPPPPPPPSLGGQRLSTNRIPDGWTFRHVPDPVGNAHAALSNAPVNLYTGSALLLFGGILLGLAYVDRHR